MIKWWTFLNGKKTSIGAAIMLAAVVVSNLSGIWIDGDAPAWLGKSIATLEYIGGALSGVGLAHKGVKAAR